VWSQQVLNAKQRPRSFAARKVVEILVGGEAVQGLTRVELTTTVYEDDLLAKGKICGGPTNSLSMSAKQRIEKPEKGKRRAKHLRQMRQDTLSGALLMKVK